jgi:hypothetical protein
MRGKAARAVE